MKGKKYENLFLKKLKIFLSTDNILITSQGRVAAYNIFKATITEKKKEILISPYTLTEVINAIIYAGAKPIYIDIDVNTGLPLQSDLDNKINNNTACLVITHLYSNREDIIKFAAKYQNKLTIVEDVAINFGSKINKNLFLGTLFDYGFYSFGIMKNLCTFHGGAIYSKDKIKLKEIENNLSKNIDYPIFLSLKLVLFSACIDILYNKYIYNIFTHYILKLSLKKLDRFMYPGVYPKFSDKKPIHYNYKFQKNFAVAGIENLKFLQNKIESRIQKVKLYEKSLNKNLILNKFSFYDINSFLEYPILLKYNKNYFLSQKLLNKGYDIRHTWYVNSVRYLKLNYESSEFNNSEYLHEKILSLPTHEKISEEDIKKITSLINSYEKY